MNLVQFTPILAVRESIRDFGNSKVEKKRGDVDKPGKGRIAGELTRKAARKQLRESLVPLQWLAQKNGFKRAARLIEEAVAEISSSDL